MRSPTELAGVFRSRGLKVTPQRECIFKVLDGAVAHPTADAVYAEARKRMPTISLKTVYQTLNDLAEMGEIQALDLGTGSSRFDPNMGPHHHLVCTRCGKVRDVPTEVASVGLPPGEVQGFVVGAAEVVLRGLCASCRAAPPTSREAHPDIDPSPIQTNPHNHNPHNHNQGEHAVWHS